MPGGALSVAPIELLEVRSRSIDASSILYRMKWNHLENGKESIRHFNIVNYPYFARLFNLYGAGYTIPLKALLYPPASAKLMQVSFDTDQDHQEALAISKSDNETGIENLNGLILFNIIIFIKERLISSKFREQSQSLNPHVTGL